MEILEVRYALVRIQMESRFVRPAGCSTCRWMPAKLPWRRSWTPAFSCNRETAPLRAVAPSAAAGRCPPGPCRRPCNPQPESGKKKGARMGRLFFFGISRNSASAQAAPAGWCRVRQFAPRCCSARRSSLLPQPASGAVRAEPCWSPSGCCSAAGLPASPEDS